MSLSSVAGILDKQGGLRVVVTQRRRMHHHVAKGERLFVVPGLEVQEPVPWNDIPAVVELVHRHVNETLAPHNHCGSCIACCRQPFIRRDAHMGDGTCVNCTSYGCKIYFNRPKACRDFECHWLKSQFRNDKMSPEMRPDRCGVLFTSDTLGGDPLLFEVHIDPQRPDSVKSDIVREYIDEMQAGGYKAKLITHYFDEDETT